VKNTKFATLTKSSEKDKILYITPSLSSFVKSDISLLSKRYPVVVNTYAWNKKLLTPFYLFHQFFFLLRHVGSTKKIIVSFGGYWSFLPALIGKLAGVEVYIILNGTDCASIPPLHYGNLRSNPLKWFCKQSYQLAAQESGSANDKSRPFFLQLKSFNVGLLIT